VATASLELEIDVGEMVTSASSVHRAQSQPSYSVSAVPAPVIGGTPKSIRFRHWLKA
jgi:hypothetical protein